LPERDRFMKKREYLEDQIAVLLGGRAAEQVVLDTMTAGASNDIERAVEIARKMVGEFGMSPLGPIYVGDSQGDQSIRTPTGRGSGRAPSLLDRVDDATNQIINAQLERACEVVTSQQESIARLVELLLERDTVEADDIRGCFSATGASFQLQSPEFTPSSTRATASRASA